jgi:hypothetical protein
MEKNEKKICPINPRGDGYCAYDKCMLFCVNSRLDDGGMCAFSFLEDIAIDLDEMNTNGIAVYMQDD